MLSRNVINKIASRIKGRNYKLDEALLLSDIIGLVLARTASLLRACIKLRRFRMHPSKWTFFGANVVMLHRRHIEIGGGVTIGDSVKLNGLSKNGIFIGDGASIGAYTIIECSGVVSDLGDGFYLGEGSGMGAFSFVGAAGGVRVGRDVIMGQRISFHSENHIFSDISRPIREQGVSRKGISIADDCWIGANVTFLDGTQLGRGCVVAAGSVVRGAFHDYSVIAGVPAKIIKSRLCRKD